MGVDYKQISVFAPVKINMFLHITGKRPDGYHLLDSLVCFADIGDHIAIEPYDRFHFEIDGPFAKEFSMTENSSHIDCDNLVVKAARRLAQITEKPLNLKITLTKNVPLAAGLGGGSSDAASTIWGLQEFWNLPRNEGYIHPLLTNLGADVPACLHCAPVQLRGIGDTLLPAPDMPEIPVLLVNPMILCSTKNVFLQYNHPFKTDIDLPDRFESPSDMSRFIDDTDNDLYQAALKTVPEIENVIQSIQIQNNCMITRMSGSGATCFGLFKTMDDAIKAERQILKDNPDWWIKTGWLNRPERY